jgi:ABC-type polysaccharide/polyol phosphate transport system ATPase subunit
LHCRGDEGVQGLESCGIVDQENGMKKETIHYFSPLDDLIEGQMRIYSHSQQVTCE